MKTSEGQGQYLSGANSDVSASRLAWFGGPALPSEGWNWSGERTENCLQLPIAVTAGWERGSCLVLTEIILSYSSSPRPHILLERGPLELIMMTPPEFILPSFKEVFRVWKLEQSKIICPRWC